MSKVYKSEAGQKIVYDTYNELLSQWNVVFEEKYIDGLYGKTHVVLAGNPNNQPLLLFHGVGDNSALMWIYNAKALSEKFHIVAVDAIGGAGKSLPNNSYYQKNNFDQIKWINELLDKLHFDKVYAVGVSYGCYLVQLFKTKLPNRFEKIVGLAGQPVVEGYKRNQLKTMLSFLPAALFPTEKNCIKLLKRLTGDGGVSFQNNPVLFSHWKALLKYFKNTSMMMHRTYSLPRDEYNIPSNEGYFILGDKDGLADVLGATSAFQELQLNYKIMKEAGHAINHEQADLVNKEIIHFLSAIQRINNFSYIGGSVNE